MPRARRIHYYSWTKLYNIIMVIFLRYLYNSTTFEARYQLKSFLILPQALVTNLASCLISRVARRLPGDWRLAYE